ncbi:GntR family transcriptional regulator [Bosea sp. BK604]|uniref:GntR family transcriptional regulator n=1 Tax=Bosea sp. BK604 TaxID=2512180 RepID=UPI0020C03954|nr:GntR family transcriptional regulator [Bosea sp. BK604]
MGDFADVQPAGSLAAQAYASLRGAIEAGELRPGMRLREEDLAVRMQMSRTPLREAVRRLEAEGFFARESRTLVVASLDHQAVSELYAMREVLEGTAAAFAARHASDSEIVALRDLLAIEADLLARPQELARHNERFHSALYGAAHNRYLLKTLNALRDARALLGPSTLLDPVRAAQAHAEHEALVSAIEAHSPAAADEAARLHIRSARRERLRRLVQTN